MFKSGELPLSSLIVTIPNDIPSVVVGIVPLAVMVIVCVVAGTNTLFSSPSIKIRSAFPELKVSGVTVKVQFGLSVWVVIVQVVSYANLGVNTRVHEHETPHEDSRFWDRHLVQD